MEESHLGPSPPSGDGGSPPLALACSPPGGRGACYGPRCCSPSAGRSYGECRMGKRYLGGCKDEAYGANCCRLGGSVVVFYSGAQAVQRRQIRVHLESARTARRQVEPEECRMHTVVSGHVPCGGSCLSRGWCANAPSEETLASREERGRRPRDERAHYQRSK